MSSEDRREQTFPDIVKTAELPLFYTEKVVIIGASGVGKSFWLNSLGRRCNELDQYFGEQKEFGLVLKEGGNIVHDLRPHLASPDEPEIEEHTLRLERRPTNAAISKPIIDPLGLRNHALKQNAFAVNVRITNIRGIVAEPTLLAKVDGGASEVCNDEIKKANLVLLFIEPVGLSERDKATDRKNAALLEEILRLRERPGLSTVVCMTKADKIGISLRDSKLPEVFNLYAPELFKLAHAHRLNVHAMSSVGWIRDHRYPNVNTSTGLVKDWDIWKPRGIWRPILTHLNDTVILRRHLMQYPTDLVSFADLYDHKEAMRAGMK